MWHFTEKLLQLFNLDFGSPELGNRRNAVVAEGRLARPLPFVDDNHRHLRFQQALLPLPPQVFHRERNYTRPPSARAPHAGTVHRALVQKGL